MMSGRPSVNFTLQSTPTAPAESPPGPMRDRPELKRSERRKSSGNRAFMIVPVVILGALGVAFGVPGAGKSLRGLVAFSGSRPVTIDFTVQPSHLPVTVVERGTLESSQNEDVF